MKKIERWMFFRELSVWLVLSLVFGSYIGVQMYDRSQNDEFVVVFQKQTEAMNRFLDGWQKYQVPIAKREAMLQLKAEKGTLPPFSCEAVFVREHTIDDCADVD